MDTPTCRSRRAWHQVSLLAGMLALHAAADCTLTNIDKRPLPEWGYRPYQSYPTGLYPNYANNRPPSHLAAAMALATNDIVPRDASGNINTNTGRILLLSVGMSNTTQEFASGDRDTNNRTNAFKYRADIDPSKNPQLVIVDGAQGARTPQNGPISPPRPGARSRPGCKIRV